MPTAAFHCLWSGHPTSRDCMQELLKLALYRVLQCGYYKWGAASPDFCPMPDALRHMHSWVKAHTRMVETLTFAPEDGSDDGRVYCLDAETNSKGDYVFTTWNETPNVEGVTVTVRE